LLADLNNRAGGISIIAGSYRHRGVLLYMIFSRYTKVAEPGADRVGPQTKAGGRFVRGLRIVGAHVVCRFSRRWILLSLDC